MDPLVNQLDLQIRKLTLRQKRFINALAEDPTSQTLAAKRAGYSEKSAHVLASRLMRHEVVQEVLRQHFVDKQEAADRLLTAAINWAQNTLDPANENVEPRDRAKAAKWVVDYTRVASGVLGLEIKPKKQPLEVEEPATADELERVLLVELEQVRKLKAEENATAETATTEEAEESGLH